MHCSAQPSASFFVLDCPLCAADTGLGPRPHFSLFLSELTKRGSQHFTHREAVRSQVTGRNQMGAQICAGSVETEFAGETIDLRSQGSWVLVQALVFRPITELSCASLFPSVNSQVS